MPRLPSPVSRMLDCWAHLEGNRQQLHQWLVALRERDNVQLLTLFENAILISYLGVRAIGKFKHVVSG
jgi:hypothetical protein